MEQWSEHLTDSLGICSPWCTLLNLYSLAAPCLGACIPAGTDTESRRMTCWAAVRFVDVWTCRAWPCLKVQDHSEPVWFIANQWLDEECLPGQNMQVDVVLLFSGNRGVASCKSFFPPERIFKMRFWLIWIDFWGYKWNCQMITNIYLVTQSYLNSHVQVIYYLEVFFSPLSQFVKQLYSGFARTASMPTSSPPPRKSSLSVFFRAHFCF